MRRRDFLIWDEAELAGEVDLRELDGDEVEGGDADYGEEEADLERCPFCGAYLEYSEATACSMCGSDLDPDGEWDGEGDSDEW